MKKSKTDSKLIVIFHSVGLYSGLEEVEASAYWI